MAPVATTLAVALETKPNTVSPIDGNIPPIVFKLNLVIGYKSTSTFLYTTLESGFGGSANTRLLPTTLYEVPGACIIPLSVISNWFSFTTKFSPSTAIGNDFLDPSNCDAILSIFLTIEVRISSELVNLFLRNRTSELLNVE